MIDDIILNKKESIERCVKQIRDYYSRPSDIPFENDYFKQDAIALNIQRAAEQCIDMANHVIKVKKLGIPKESRQVFVLLARAGIISGEMSKLLQAMVGFRNILVHEYQEIEIKIMTDVIENQLDELVRFTIRVMEV